jgi:peptidoglycan/LPS O-acetylase OafA/YrhL
VAVPTRSEPFQAEEAEEPATPSAPRRRNRGLGYQPALDGLRAVAVLAVIAYHDNYTWARGGFLGVDMFFVLSGFLITTLLVVELRRSGAIRFAGFWARRARRLLPALLLTLLFVGIFTYLVVVPWQQPAIRGDMLGSLFYVANWRFIFNSQSYFQLFSSASPLRHMWSLAIEEQYYLVWPLIVYACVRVGRGSTRLLAAVCVIGIAVSIYLMRARFRIDDPSAAYYATDARAHALLIGSLLAVILLVWEPGALVKRALPWAGVVAAVIVLIWLHDTSATDRSYYYGGSAIFALVVAVLIAAVLQRGAVSSLLSLRPIVWIGTISYGLYLWHWPINVWLIPSRVHVSDNALNLVRLLVTFAVATLSFHLIERPIRTRTWRPRITAAAFVPAIAVGLVAILFVFGGAPGHFAPLREAIGIQADAAPAAPAATAAPVAPASPSAPVSAAQPAVSPANGLGGSQEQAPSYLWSYGDPLLCLPPRPSETQEAANAAATTQAVPKLPDSVRGQRILLVGDSTACSLWTGLQASGQAEGIRTDQASVFGCGVASGEVTTTRDEAVTPHSSRCRSLVDVALHNAFVRMTPTVVVWMSIWEKSDLVAGNKILVAGSPAWEAEINARMDAALARFTAVGARVVILTEAAPAPNPAAATDQVNHKADDAGYARLTGLLKRFQARHPDTVTLVDLASQVCPSGPPCPENVDGMQLRPDGHHFTPTAATWAANWLLTQIYRVP